MGGGELSRAWLGSGRVAQVAIGAWRLASIVSGLALVAPIMLVGRRPYRLGRLADRLRAVQDMAVIPDSLPDQLAWFRVAVVATVIGGVVMPARFRHAHLIASVPALVLAVLVRRGAQRSDWTSATTQLGVTVAALAVAVAAALLPTPGDRQRANE